MKVPVVTWQMAEPTQCDIGDDFIGIHIGRRAGATLHHVHNEVFVMPSFNNFVAR